MTSARQTLAFGARLAKRLYPGAVVTLTGPLGAGKTTLAQGVAKALGIQEPVTSPTYTIISDYPSEPPLYHMDLYRLAGVEDFEMTGGRDYLEGQGICLIEWADRIAEILPPHTIRIELELRETGRLVRWEGIEL